MAKESKLTQRNYESILHHLFDRIHKTGEEIKNDFPNILRTAIKTEAWKHFHDLEGKPFTNLVDWLHHTFPNGAGLGLGQNAITYQDALALTEGAPDVKRVLAENAPKAKPGRKKRSDENGSLRNHFGHSNMSKPVLTARLAQEHPKIYDAYLRGEYRSIRAAAEAAGLVKSGNETLARLKSNWNKATAAERRSFMEWMKEQRKRE
jgi:hypothetical protein